MYAILSDIHGNLQALESVFEDMLKFSVEGLIILGDTIDYGMQSDEVVSLLENQNKYPVICEIWGNHENAILNRDYHGFSSTRGVASARHTESIMHQNTRKYLEKLTKEGIKEFSVSGKQCLAVHGSLEDIFWKGIIPENVRGEYIKYDVVLSGHTHYSHYFTKFYEVDCPQKRNKKATYFINPGSVGQPRNYNINAQYALIDFNTMEVSMRSVPYNIRKAQSMFQGQVDDFYKDRLTYGI